MVIACGESGLFGSFDEISKLFEGHYWKGKIYVSTIEIDQKEPNCMGYEVKSSNTPSVYPFLMKWNGCKVVPDIIENVQFSPF